jgi:single-strand DNA-binding protein
VYIEGRLQTRSYDDKNTGTKKYITEIVADNMIMLDGRGAAEPHQQSGAAPVEDAAATTGKDDDLPF